MKHDFLTLKLIEDQSYALLIHLFNDNLLHITCMSDTVAGSGGTHWRANPRLFSDLVEMMHKKDEIFSVFNGVFIYFK